MDTRDDSGDDGGDDGRDSTGRRADANDAAPGRSARTPAAVGASALLRALGAADPAAATARVAALRRQDPDATADALAERILASACRRTALIGAATSSAAVLPGLGTLASLTLGTTADLAATLRLQAQMVLELAAAHDFPLDRLDSRTVTLLVTGVSGGGAVILENAGQRISTRLAERAAGRWLAHALPVLGMAASAGTNVLTTYVIGTRALAYVRGGPEAVASWHDSVRALTGVDERRLAGWLGERGADAWAALRAGSRRVGDAGYGAIGEVGAWLARGGRRVGGRARSLGSSLAAGVSGRARRPPDGTTHRAEADRAVDPDPSAHGASAADPELAARASSEHESEPETEPGSEPRSEAGVGPRSDAGG